MTFLSNRQLSKKSNCFLFKLLCRQIRRSSQSSSTLRLKEDEIREKQAAWGIEGTLSFEALSKSHLEKIAGIKQSVVKSVENELAEVDAKLALLRKDAGGVEQIVGQQMVRRELKAKLENIKELIFSLFIKTQSQLYKLFNEAIKLAQQREPLSEILFLKSLCLRQMRKSFQGKVLPGFPDMEMMEMEMMDFDVLLYVNGFVISISTVTECKAPTTFTVEIIWVYQKMNH